MNSEKQFNNSDDLEREKLRAMLLEDTDSPAEADSLLEVVGHLRKWRAPRPEREATALLIEWLSSQMPESAEPRNLLQLIGESWPLLLARAQLRVVRRDIWAASALVMVLGTLVTLANYSSTPNGLTAIAIFAPVVAAFGVAFLYDTDMEQMLEIENSTPASTRLLLLTRLTLVFTFDLGLGLMASICLSLVHANVLLWPLVLSWLAPMAFLSASSFLLSILLSDALIGSIFGLLVWGTHVWMRAFPGADIFSQLLSLPGLGSPEFRPLLIGVAILLIGFGLWIVGREDRIISTTN